MVVLLPVSVVEPASYVLAVVEAPASTPESGDVSTEEEVSGASYGSAVTDPLSTSESISAAAAESARLSRDFGHPVILTRLVCQMCRVR